MTNYQITVQFYCQFSGKKSYSTDFENSIFNGEVDQLISNGKSNQLIFFEENMSQISANDIAPKIKNTLEANTIPAIFYAKKGNSVIKIIIPNDPKNVVSIIPQAPFCIKKGFGSAQEAIDLAFYVEIALGLCENFAIYQFSTEVIEAD